MHPKSAYSKNRAPQLQKSALLLFLGLCIFLTQTLAVEAQVLPGGVVETQLGDTRFGIVATVTLLPLNQPLVPPQGKLLISPTQNSPLSRELAKELLVSANGNPPRRYFKLYRLAMDGKPYQSTAVHPWIMPTYYTALPYAPQTLKVTGLLSTDESFTTTINLPPEFNIDRTIDLRTHEVQQPSSLHTAKNASVGIKLVKPYRDQTAYGIFDFSDTRGGGSLKIVTTCLASQASGRIINSRLTLKKHYFYAPDGDLTLTQTTFHQPVYGTDEGIQLISPLYVVSDPPSLKPLRNRRPDDRGDDPDNPYPAEFVLECRTEKGKLLRREFEYRYINPKWSNIGA